MNTRHFARLLAPLTALTLAAPALAQEGGSVSDFQLPTSQPTPRGQTQGPVVEGIPAPRAPRPTPTRAAAPPPAAAPTPAPTVAASPRPLASASPRAVESGAAEDRARAEPERESEETLAAPEEAETRQPETAAAQSPLAAQPAPVAAARPDAPASGGIAWWIWLLALLAVGAIGAAAGWFWRGRRAEAPLVVPQIERPRVPEAAAPELPLEPSGPPAELPKVALTRPPRETSAPEPAVAVPDEDEDFDSASPLRVALEPARLSVSLLNATLAYRILLTNKGDEALRNISIDGDMVSAHASLSQEEQLAASNSKLENRHLVRSLAPGETKVVRGEFTLPLPLIRPIRKGEATLFVPLARLRVVAGNGGAPIMVQTSVVGQRSPRPGGGLRPFRLDLGPRIYSELGQRAFA